MNNRIILVLLSIIMVGNAYAQSSKVDSLQTLLQLHKTNDTVKVNLLNEIALGAYEKDPDKARSYATKAAELSGKLSFQKGKAESLMLIGLSDSKSDKPKALAYLQDALKIAESSSYKLGQIKCLNSIGDLNRDLGQFPVATARYQKAFLIAEETNNKLELANCRFNLAKIAQQFGKNDEAIDGYNNAISTFGELGELKLQAKCNVNLGALYASMGNYPKSLACFQIGLEIAEKINDKVVAYICLIGTGNIYSSQGNLKKSFEYYQKALKLAEDLRDKTRITACLNNIGVYYLRTNNPRALDCFQKVLANSKELQEPVIINGALDNIGVVYENQGNLAKAMEYYQQSLKFLEEKGMKDFSGQTLYYAGRICLKQKKYSEALSYTLKSLDIAFELKLLTNKKNLYKQLSDIYAATNNYKMAYINHQRFKDLNDSIFNESNVRKIAELEYRYKYEKEKQALELQQQKKDVIQAAEKRQQRIVMFSFIGAFILVSLLAVYVYHSYRIKRQSNIVLMQQKQEIEAKNEDLVLLNEEISAQREEISAQRDELETQRDLVVLQKDHIQAQKEKITDSIDYARHIQQALLPSSEFAADNLGEHFILFKPKDVVSGDFYWATRVNEYLIVTVADCTGHGVPGAFMSMLGISFLNEIVGKKEVVKASEILDQLRKSVIDALQQKWQTGEQKDGMDMALVVINTQTAQLQYAGAHNSLYIVAKGKELQEIKPDNQTVAINIEMKSFTNHEVGLNKGDCIYLATDGYHDQFGGPNNKKFKGKQLKELLLSIVEKPMNEQREVLDSTFEQWRGNGEQIDDVTIIGLRV